MEFSRGGEEKEFESLMEDAFNIKKKPVCFWKNKLDNNEKLRVHSWTQQRTSRQVESQQLDLNESIDWNRDEKAKEEETEKLNETLLDSDQLILQQIGKNSSEEICEDKINEEFRKLNEEDTFDNHN